MTGFGKTAKKEHRDASAGFVGFLCALFDRVIPIDLEVCRLAIELRRSATDRLPTIDSLIAATAAVNDAVLVHRDPHFKAIPGGVLKQEFLGEAER
jgi:predicted nucleic acid-binding protein